MRSLETIGFTSWVRQKKITIACFSWPPCKVFFPMERRHIWKGGRKIYDPKGKHCGAQLWVGGSQGPAVFMRVMITQYHKITTKPKHTDA